MLTYLYIQVNILHFMALYCNCGMYLFAGVLSISLLLMLVTMLTDNEIILNASVLSKVERVQNFS